MTNHTPDAVGEALSALTVNPFVSLAHVKTIEAHIATLTAKLAAQSTDDARWERALDRATDRIVAAQGAAPVAAPPEGEAVRVLREIRRHFDEVICPDCGHEFTAELDY